MKTVILKESLPIYSKREGEIHQLGYQVVAQKKDRDLEMQVQLVDVNAEDELIAQFCFGSSRLDEHLHTDAELKLRAAHLFKTMCKRVFSISGSNLSLDDDIRLLAPVATWAARFLEKQAVVKRFFINFNRYLSGLHVFLRKEKKKILIRLSFSRDDDTGQSRLSLKVGDQSVDTLLSIPFDRINQNLVSNRRAVRVVRNCIFTHMDPDDLISPFDMLAFKYPAQELPGKIRQRLNADLVAKFDSAIRRSLDTPVRTIDMDLKLIRVPALVGAAARVAAAPVQDGSGSGAGAGARSGAGVSSSAEKKIIVEQALPVYALGDSKQLALRVTREKLDDKVNMLLSLIDKETGAEICRYQAQSDWYKEALLLESDQAERVKTIVNRFRQKVLKLRYLNISNASEQIEYHAPLETWCRRFDAADKLHEFMLTDAHQNAESLPFRTMARQGRQVQSVDWCLDVKCKPFKGRLAIVLTGRSLSPSPKASSSQTFMRIDLTNAYTFTNKNDLDFIAVVQAIRKKVFAYVAEQGIVKDKWSKRVLASDKQVQKLCKKPMFVEGLVQCVGVALGSNSSSVVKNYDTGAQPEAIAALNANRRSKSKGKGKGKGKGRSQAKRSRSANNALDSRLTGRQVRRRLASDSASAPVSVPRPTTYSIGKQVVGRAIVPRAAAGADCPSAASNSNTLRPMLGFSPVLQAYLNKTPLASSDSDSDSDVVFAGESESKQLQSSTDNRDHSGAPAEATNTGPAIDSDLGSLRLLSLVASGKKPIVSEDQVEEAQLAASGARPSKG